jgi:hypothetical protein
MSITPISSASRACGPSLRGFCLVERRNQPAELAVGHRDNDVILRSELVVDSRFRDANGVGDHLQRCPAYAMLGEQVQRGIQHARPGRAVLGNPEFSVGEWLLR